MTSLTEGGTEGQRGEGGGAERERERKGEGGDFAKIQTWSIWELVFWAAAGTLTWPGTAWSLVLLYTLYIRKLLKFFIIY